MTWNYMSGWWQLKHFLCSPRTLGQWSNLTSIFFRWVGSTTSLQIWNISGYYGFTLPKFSIPTWSCRSRKQTGRENYFRNPMYGIFIYIYHINQPNVGKYTIHGSLGNLSGRWNASLRDNTHRSEKSFLQECLVAFYTRMLEPFSYKQKLSKFSQIKTVF